MKFGALITNFNSSETLERAINSALKQNISFSKIVVVDDCSSAKELEAVQTICARFDEIELHCNEHNLGYAGSLNQGVKLLVCDFIFILDDDDESLPWRVEMQGRLLTEGFDLVYSSRLVDSAGKISLNPSVDFTKLLPHSLGILNLLFTGRYKQRIEGQFGSCTLAFRRSVFINLGGFDTQFRRKAEWDFLIRCADVKSKIISTSLPCIIQYKTEGFRGEKSLSLSKEMDKRLISKHYDKLKSLGILNLSKIYLAANLYKFHRKRFSFLINLIILKVLRILKYDDIKISTDSP